MSNADLSIAEIAARLKADLEGDGNTRIRGIATLRNAGPDQLAWLGDARFAKLLPETKAGAVLVPPTALPDGGPTRIRVPDPDLAMLTISTWFAPPRREIAVGVHPSAVVAADAQVEGAAIGPHCSVESGAVIEAGAQLFAGVRIGCDARVGRDSILRENVVVGDRCELGARVSVFPNTTIGADGFGFLYRDGELHRIPQIGSVVIEDDVELGANTCVDRARTGVTRIRRGTKIDNLVQVAHNCDVGPGAILAAQTGISGSATLEQGVVCGGQVGVADHVRVGAGAQIAAQAGVLTDVDGQQKYRGYPAIEFQASGRQLVATRRLPEALRALTELTKRVEQLESAAHDSKRS